LRRGLLSRIEIFPQDLFCPERLISGPPRFSMPQLLGFFVIFNPERSETLPKRLSRCSPTPELEYNFHSLRHLLFLIPSPSGISTRIISRRVLHPSGLYRKFPFYPAHPFLVSPFTCSGALPPPEIANHPLFSGKVTKKVLFQFTLLPFVWEKTTLFSFSTRSAPLRLFSLRKGFSGSFVVMERKAPPSLSPPRRFRPTFSPFF